MFKPPSGGRIARSSGIVRFVQGGVVKTFRWADELVAVFQYQTKLLPASAAELHRSAFCAPDFDVNAFNDLNVWATQPAQPLLDTCRSLLPTNKSWGPCEEFEGPTDTWGSDLRIWHDDDNRNRVREISFRYSAADGFDLLNRFLLIASDFDCMLYSVDTNAVFAPDSDSFLADFGTTRAARFFDDPMTTLRDAAAEIDANRNRRPT